MKWTAVVACLLTLLVPTAGFAQESRSQDRLSDEPQTPRTSSHPLLDAALRAARREEHSAGGFSQQPAQRSWPSRHPVGFGALVGAGAGSIIAPVAFLSTTGISDEEAGFAVGPTFAVVGAGIGAGIGALTGWIISTARR